MSKQTNGTTHNNSAKSSLWNKPEVKRIHAGQAEGAANTGMDNVVYS